MKAIQTDKAPAAIGPYSQAMVAGGFVHCSGQIGLDPATGKLVGDDVAAQARQVLANLQAVLAAAGIGIENVVSTTIYLMDLKDFAVVNEIYAAFFGAHKPARATVQVAGLPLGAKVEIACVGWQD